MDWELFEIKRPIKLNRTYRNIPTITNEVYNAVQQIKNYSRILSQDEVRKKFAQEGIEYYEPSLNLIIGKKPQIPIEQWRFLLANFDNQVKLFTFNDLLKEMKNRYDHIIKLFESHD